MKIIKVDSKKRLTIPWAKPGDVFDCERRDDNYFLLTRMNPIRQFRKTSAKTETQKK